jgi:predicted AAA+ superfamily ATPase
MLLMEKNRNKTMRLKISFCPNLNLKFKFGQIILLGMRPRVLEHTIRRAMRTFPAILITGPRQSGKTTLLTERFSKTHQFVSIENPDVRARLLDDPIGFLKAHPPPVILDEIQYAPEFLHYIKTAIDENRQPGQWLLSGSQNFALMQGVSQTLSGRIAILNLLPFSLGESIGAGKQNYSIDEIISQVFSSKDHSLMSVSYTLDDWILRGSYPEIRTNPQVDRQLWCASYIQTYLERDVRQIINVGDLNTFDRFLRVCAARTGQILNLSEISRDVGMSVPTIKKWISILEASYQIYLLPPHFRNFGKRVIKSAKIYFLDPAIASFLMGLHASEPLLNGPMIGHLFETVVISEWVKAFYHRGEKPELFYWRSKAGLEIDLLIDRNQRLFPLETKASATLLPGHAKALNEWLNLAGEETVKGVIVANIDNPMEVSGCREISWNHAL